MGIRIFHRWHLMEDLDITDPGEYGFDTLQIGQYNTATSMDKIRAEIGRIDDQFTEGDDPGIILSFQFWGDGGDPIAIPNYNPVASQVGIIQRDSWYNNPDAPFYNQFKSFLQAAVTGHGSRIKGVRWNHEIGAERFKPGPVWSGYAMQHNPQDFQLVTGDSDLTGRWNTWMQALADETTPSLTNHHAYQGSGSTFTGQWASADYAPVQRLYHNFVDFQVDVQKTMIQHMAAKMRQVDPNLKFVIYSPQQGPDTTYAHSEYTLRLDEVTDSNVIWEISAWHRRVDVGTQNERLAQTAAQWNAWASQPTSQQKYMFVLQQGDSGLVSDVSGIIDALLHPTVTAGGHQPWENSLGMWSAWRTTDTGRSIEDQRAYMAAVKEGLT